MIPLPPGPYGGDPGRRPNPDGKASAPVGRMPSVTDSGPPRRGGNTIGAGVDTPPVNRLGTTGGFG